MQPTTVSEKTRTRRRIVAVAILVLVAAAIGAFFFMRKDSSQFVKEYGSYETLATTQETDTYLPASPDNPLRQQLDTTLSQTLDQSISSSDRLKLAQQGVDLVAQLDREVDAIGTSSEPANTALAKLQVDTYGGVTSSDAARNLISLAEQRSSIIEDIRGLSYRADFETDTIFQNIVDAKGVLAPAYVTQLNDDIPSLEADFDHRTALYTQLTQVTTQIDQAETGLGIPVPVSTSSVPQ